MLSILFPLMVPVVLSIATPKPMELSSVTRPIEYVHSIKEDAEKEVNKIQIEKQKKEKENKTNKKLLGNFYITAYAETGNPCANGNYPTVGKTVACNSLPMGTKIYIEGVGERIVEDRGASWHVDNWADLYLGDVSTCIEWGKQQRNVYIIN